ADASYLLPERLLEATVAVGEAQKSGDAGKIAKAQEELEAVKKAQAVAASATVPQAPADAPSSAQ
ncbi:MAG: hypothetical protein JF571_11625, partial [Asticcacaulis sp.]|nr:hypothetical protein [Asticcacaulis sp.]